jgi:hypothetical protein
MDNINDKTLIEISTDGNILVFYICIMISITSLTAAWGSVSDLFVRFKAPYAFTTAESNIANLAKELKTPDPRIAIVGSSLSKRLDAGLFANVKVMNLSVGGGSVMTGLEVLSNAQTLPKVILVEINILDRPVDEEWMNKGIVATQWQPWAVLAGVSKPFRYLLSEPVFSYLPQEQQDAWWRNARTAYRSRESATYDIQTAISAGSLAWSKRNDWDIAYRNFDRIQELVPKLESRGAKVYFLFMPYADEYDSHSFARKNREIASGNDSFNCTRCIDVRKLVAVETLRWDDGAHLDDKSALIVAEALEERLIPEL